MTKLITLHSVLLWPSVVLITVLSKCPSLDIYEQISSPPDENDYRRNVTSPELWAYPFIVSLTEKHTVTKLTRHVCGGVIVTLGAVLTSCRCAGAVVRGRTVVHRRCKKFIVLAGTPDMYLENSAHRQLRKSSSCMLHPLCNLTEVITHDAALVFLKANLTLATNTQPFTVFSMNLDEFRTKLVYLAQLNVICYQPIWFSGSMYYGIKPNFPGFIDEGKRQLLKWKKCQEMHCNFEDEGPACRNGFVGGFCAATYHGSPPTATEIGGPLLCHGWVVGITSIPTSDACSPSVYVGPSVWLDLIRDLHPDSHSRALLSRVHSSTGPFMFAYAALNFKE